MTAASPGRRKARADIAQARAIERATARERVKKIRQDPSVTLYMRLLRTLGSAAATDEEKIAALVNLCADALIAKAIHGQEVEAATIFGRMVRLQVAEMVLAPAAAAAAQAQDGDDVGGDVIPFATGDGIAGYGGDVPPDVAPVTAGDDVAGDSPTPPGDDAAPDVAPSEPETIVP